MPANRCILSLTSLAVKKLIDLLTRKTACETKIKPVVTASIATTYALLRLLNLEPVVSLPWFKRRTPCELFNSQLLVTL
jgi:maleate cis-trans isomerase